MADHKVNFSRRRTLQAGLAAAALFAPVRYAWVWAQSEGAMKLLRAPKQALVIGNSNYKSSPLRNPANDARAIGEALKGAGFDVTTRLDAPHGELVQAVRAYTQALAQRQAIGLFYFAGHGLQLAWRNYMVPVDASVRAAADIQAQCVELGELLAGITKARNPLNVIILDACRDNPFGGLAGVDQKGLSQMDAPPSTLLAYATAPGNVASDGEGANGLYTEHLLKEISVPEAKVEDVFKRVRLHVRRRTNGQQIPWESTSLEEDFWFVPPKELKRLSEAEAAREFEAELMIWEKIKASKEPGPLEDYLRRYPGGKFSELAQFQLDRVLAAQGEKKIEIAPRENNPFTKGTARADTNFKIGDRYSTRRMDLLTRLEGRGGTFTVTGITETEVIFNKGNIVTDFLGNPRKLPTGHTNTGSQHFISEYSVGKHWGTTYRGTRRDGTPDEWTMNYRVVGTEQITVPAGTFETFKIEGSGFNRGGGNTYSRKYWIAPGKVRRPIASEEVNRERNGTLYDNDRIELVSYRES